MSTWLALILAVYAGVHVVLFLISREPVYLCIAAAACVVSISAARMARSD